MRDRDREGKTREKAERHRESNLRPELNVGAFVAVVKKKTHNHNAQDNRDPRARNKHGSKKQNDKRNGRERESTKDGNTKTKNNHTECWRG